MADLKRWFKAWSTIVHDPHFQELPLEDIGRWVMLGALMVSSGEGGRLRSPAGARVLCALLRVPDARAAKVCLQRLPHVHIEEGKSDNDEFTVTMDNWIRYQVDSTVYERVKRLRSKRRGEEIRGDKRRVVGRGVLTDAQFLESLKANPAYAGIDLDRELGKMDGYLLTPRAKGRRKTRQFIVGWLNRIDRPMAAPTVEDEDAE